MFAGIAGLELGLDASNHETLLFCENDPGAVAVLGERFPDIPLHKDITTLKHLPNSAELVTAGFPCQDLSQAGRTEGINGTKSSLVAYLFRLLKWANTPHVLIENVPFMLQLNRGQAMKYLVDQLEALGYDWAYRVVNAHAFGLPQRRRRVFLLASREYEPWHALFADNAMPASREYEPGVACGFYWTEGSRGLGWAVDAIPTLKSGSTVGIPSPPAIWLPNGRIVKPDIRDVERFQGFPVDWTEPAENAVRRGYRWKLIGNAVSVAASTWLGQVLKRINETQDNGLIPYAFSQERSWPSAAFGSARRGRHAVEISEWPVSESAKPLDHFLKYEPEDLSLRATSGFSSRLFRSTLRYPEDFSVALRDHIDRMQSKEGAK